MTVVKSLADMNPAYSREVQCSITAKPPLRDRGTQGYAEVRERATKDGVTRCEDCNRPIPKGKEEAHHLRKRSQLGGNEIGNLVLVCRDCHSWREAHGGKKKPGRKAR